MMASELKVKPEQIIDFKLLLCEYCDAMGYWGHCEDTISSSRLDDLQAVCAGLDALSNSKPGKYIKVLVCFDN